MGWDRQGVNRRALVRKDGKHFKHKK